MFIGSSSAVGSSPSERRGWVAAPRDTPGQHHHHSVMIVMVRVVTYDDDLHDTHTMGCIVTSIYNVDSSI